MINIFDNLGCHTAMIVGRRGRGKSYFACELLEKTFKDHFDYVILICPTIKNNKAYLSRRWIMSKDGVKNDENVFVFANFEDLDLLIEKLTKKFAYQENCHTLFLLDDCAFDNSIKNKRESLTRLAFNSRHMGISLWILTQKYNNVNKSFREQISWLAIYYCKDKDSFTEALDENNAVEYDKRLEIHEYLKKSTHGKLIIRNDPPICYKII